MQVSTSRGRLELDPGRNWGQPRLALTAVVDDVLGLPAPAESADADAWAEHLLRYGLFWGAPVARDGSPGGWHPHTEEGRRAWQEWASELRLLFQKAVADAHEGHISEVLAPHLVRVRYTPDPAPDEIPDGDLGALAAWSLVEALRRQDIVVRKCAHCQRPSVSLLRQDYCERPAPGYFRTCREIVKEQRFLAKPGVGGYRREYKRLHELKRRGTITLAQLNAWRQANQPDDWKVYADWLEAQAKKEGS